MNDTRCNKCSTFLVFTSSLAAGKCVTCRGERLVPCAATGCGSLMEKEEPLNYCVIHRTPSPPEKNPLRSRCVLCKIKDIPIDGESNALDNSRPTPTGLMHSSCYDMAKSIFQNYVEVNQKLPTTNIRVRKMRIDP